MRVASPPAADPEKLMNFGAAGVEGGAAASTEASAEKAPHPTAFLAR